MKRQLRTHGLFCVAVAAVLVIGGAVSNESRAAPITIPNGDFETLYKPGTAITGVVSAGGWTQGVGPDCPIDTGAYEFSDLTTGDFADIPGWIGYDRQGWIDNGGTYGRDETTGNLQGSVAAQFSTPDGTNYYLANGGEWGNPAGGLIVSDAPLATVEANTAYTLSMLARWRTDPAATPVALDLLADGVALTATSSVDPALSGEWQEFSRTYEPASLAGSLGQSLTVQLGVARGAIGTQSLFDQVSLSADPTGGAQPPATPGPAGFAYQQTDAATGTGNIAVYNGDGILFTGAMPGAAVVQNDATGEPVPGGVVGFITGGTEGNPGGGIGVHLGWSGTTKLTGRIRDDLDPNTATSNPNVVNVYEVEVALKAVTDEPHYYEFNTFDDNSGVGGSNDVTNNLTHRAWVGDNGDGHRQSDGTYQYTAGPNTYAAEDTDGFNLGDNAQGDDLGITAGVGGTAPDGTLFVDKIAFYGVLEATGEPTLVGIAFAPSSVSGVITSVTLTGSGLAPEGTSIETGAFDEDALSFTDRTHEWNSDTGQLTIAQLGLTGVDYVRFANDDRSPGDLEAVIELEPGAKNLFLLIDDRIDEDNVVNIFNGNMFADTGVHIGVDESGDGDIDQVSSLYVLPNFEGTSITLGPQGQGGTNMYGFLAQPVPTEIIPEPATMAMLGLAVAGLGGYVRRRRRA